MSNMNFNCDVCGREVFGCTFVNGMKLCAKCYQETFGETDKDRKIADLEAKLAESESKRKILEEKVKWLSEENEECFVDGQKYNELREQKDKEIQDLKQQLAEKTLTIEQINKAFIENRSLWKGKYEQSNQDKISFAVKQLEKLKVELHIIHTNGYLKAIDEEIDNQINELKGEK